MKKFIKLGVVLTCSFLLVGCTTKEKKNSDESSTIESTSTSKTSSEISNTDSSSDSASNVDGESVDITTKGQYFVGSDIKPGTYYIVLTDLDYSDDDPEKQAWVSYEVSGKNNYYEMLFKVGEKKRIVLSEGDTITFEDNYSPKSWKIRLLNDDDFKKYTKENN